MTYFKRHIFFCLNQRDNGEDACANHNAQAGFERCKARAKAEKLNGPVQLFAAGFLAFLEGHANFPETQPLIESHDDHVCRLFRQAAQRFIQMRADPFPRTFIRRVENHFVLVG